MRKNRKVKDTSDNRVRKTIKRFGYAYNLVTADRGYANMPTPCFMGESGFALESCHKIQST